LPGFLLSGFLLALLGAILPAWGYHRDPADFTAVGNYFLSLAIGIVLAALSGRRVMERKGIGFLLTLSCSVSCAALVYLALVSPPVSAWWRIGGMLALGVGAGLLNVGLFHAMSGYYTGDRAGTVNRGGIWYGSGCLVSTLMAGLAFGYDVKVILLVMATVPAAFGIRFRRTGYETLAGGKHPAIKQALHDFRSPGAILFALLLFFQFGNEWSLAGWLPLLLNRRIGVAPKEAILFLALYWLFLLAGRMAAVAILPRVRHGHLLFGSVFSALFGCLVLFLTNNPFGAASGIFFLGAGYASIYPLVAEAIGRRFPYYHPGFFNGVFSLALIGGLLAPATLGYAAHAFGVGVVIGIPLLGTCLVMTLLLLIWLESKVTGR
jgi:hypothetical protein